MDDKNVSKPKNNVLLIACYEKPYSKRSLEMIRGTIYKEKPTKIIILKIIEKPKMKDKLDTRIGEKAKENFLDSVLKDKKEKVDRYAQDVLKITDDTDIPTEVRLRKAEVIADEILEDYERMDIDHIILHDEERALLDRLAKGKVKEEVEKQAEEADVTTVK